MASGAIESFLKGSYPRVTIPAWLMEYIREIVDQEKNEVSWVMEVTDKGNYDYNIDAVFIPRQRVNGATTEFNAQDIMKLLEEEPTFKPEKWRGWGHSHVNFGVTPSGQDRTMMMEFANTCDFFIGMIHNKKGDVFCWLIDNKREIFFKDVEVCVISEYQDEVAGLLKERVSILKVEEPPKTTKTTGSTTAVSQAVPTPFHHKGYQLTWTTKLVNGMTKSGYEIKGLFFPYPMYPGPDMAIAGYELYLEALGATGGPTEDEVPTAHQLEILDELEDYALEVANSSGF